MPFTIFCFKIKPKKLAIMKITNSIFKKYLIYLFILCTPLLSNNIKSNDDIIMNKIKFKFNDYVSRYYLQKVFVHTDKENFIVNENIWFKTYLLNGRSHKFDTISTNLYVELINPNKEIIQIRLLKIKNGVANGHFFLPDSLTSGNYQIRAFTNLMKNVGHNYLFTKKIKIFNDRNYEITREQFSEYKKNKRKKNYVDIVYFPQNKQLVYDIKNQVCFKTIDYMGNGLKTKGYIIDNNKNRIADFETDNEGNGFVSFMPKKENKYKIELFTSNNKKKKFKLPKIEEHGFAFDLKQNQKNIIVNINANLIKTNAELNKTFYLIAHIRGKIVYSHSQVVENEENVVLNIDKDKIQTGVVHFTLFDARKKVHAEKLIFVNKNDNFKIHVTENRKGDYIELKIKTTDNKAKQIPAKLSLSVNCVKEQKFKTNIISSILLNSDLSNKYSSLSLNPDSITYLTNANTWNKYSWENILKSKQDSALFTRENNITISGYVTKVYGSIVSANSTISLSVLSTFNDYFVTTTDKKGYFAFPNLDYNDTIDILLEGFNENGKKNILIYKNNYDTIPINFNSINNDYLKQYSSKNIIIDKLKGKRERAGSLHSNADQVIYFKNINASSYSTIFDVLTGRVPGFEYSGGTPRLRGYSSINLSSEPLYLINDIPVGFGSINSVSPENVERVEIIKSSATNAIYGSRGANGVIAVYTKKGHKIVRGREETHQLGYHKPTKFYFSEIKYPKNFFSTYFWSPEITTNSSKYVTIKFKLPENIKNYKVNIQGVSETGNVSSFEQKF